jgi:hypothetical protein
VSEFTGQQGKIIADVRYDDYRATDGVNTPRGMKFKMDAGGQEFEFSVKLLEVRHNVPIEDAKFAKPAS